MISQRSISNNYADTQLLNMDPESPARGPFLITQVGSAPGDPTVREKMWVLRLDGSWADINHYLATGKLDSMNECLFESAGKAIEILSTLAGPPVIADLPVDNDALRSVLGNSPQVTPGIPAIKAWIARYKDQQKPA